ncbi:unnamed protein product [Calypogeia fissa]
MIVERRGKIVLCSRCLVNRLLYFFNKSKRGNRTELRSIGDDRELHTIVLVVVPIRVLTNIVLTVSDGSANCSGCCTARTRICSGKVE